MVGEGFGRACRVAGVGNWAAGVEVGTMGVAEGEGVEVLSERFDIAAAGALEVGEGVLAGAAATGGGAEVTVAGGAATTAGGGAGRAWGIGVALCVGSCGTRSSSASLPAIHAVASCAETGSLVSAVQHRAGGRNSPRAALGGNKSAWKSMYCLRGTSIEMGRTVSEVRMTRRLISAFMRLRIAGGRTARPAMVVGIGAPPGHREQVSWERREGGSNKPSVKTAGPPTSTHRTVMSPWSNEGVSSCLPHTRDPLTLPAR